mmetsp:Transcript_40904/g.94817  ORF Transcript_40904/g.94817 Transcript_40904/m.94817 type:complete len:248 (+) Transcript_40904:1494-2237(+)
MAAIAPVHGKLHDLAAPPLLPGPARCAALAPLEPVADGAVTPIAGSIVASLDLHQARRALPATCLRVLHHLAVADVLAASAGLVALVPRGPLRELAVAAGGAGLQLSQGGTARLASVLRSPQQLTVTDLSAAAVQTARAIAPGAPVAHDAGDGLASALLCAAHAQLLKFAFAHGPTVLRGVLDRTLAGLQATAAAAGTGTPARPLAEAAGCDGGRRLAARRGLFEVALALLAAVGGVLSDRPAAVSL